VEKHVGTLVSLSKQLGISVSTLNTIIKNNNINVENANQYGPMVKKQKYVKKSMLYPGLGVGWQGERIPWEAVWGI
jgi:hypothetical protein